MTKAKQQYKYIREKNYLFYSPSLIIDYLFYHQNKNSYEISKSEYRKFKRYNIITQNLKKIFFFYYSHKIQIDKIGKGKSLFDFYYFGKTQIVNNDTNFTILPTTEEKIIYSISKNNLNLKFSYNPTTHKPFIIVSCKFGLLWVTLKKTAYKKLNKFMYPSYMIDSIISEIEKLITKQSQKKKDYISELFKFDKN